jgi:hypothetical protein
MTMDVLERLNFTLAHARRLYHHAFHGGTVSATSLSLLVKSLEDLQDRLDREERLRIAIRDARMSPEHDHLNELLEDEE